MTLTDLQAEEGRLSRAIASLQQQLTILERYADDTQRTILLAEYDLKELRENLRTLRAAPVVSLQSFKSIRIAIADTKSVLRMRREELQQHNEQIATNIAKLDDLDEDLCANLSGQGEYGQVLYLPSADDR
jgi:chromosome segregation ATPase